MYVGNNPISFTDPTGMIGALPDPRSRPGFAAFVPVSFAAAAIRAKQSRPFQKGSPLTWGLEGAVEGLFAGFGPAGFSVEAAQLAAAVCQMQGVSVGRLNVSPSFAYRSYGTAYSIGASISFSQPVGRFTFSFGSSFTSGSGFTGTPNNEWQIGYGVAYASGNFRSSWYRTHYSASDGTSQVVGGLGLGVGRISARTENDFLFGDGGDRYRTAALQLSYRVRSGTEISVGFKLHTGDPGPKNERETESYPLNDEGYYTSGSSLEPSMRAGVLYLGVKHNGRVYQFGEDSERIRNLIQNGWHRLEIHFPFLGTWEFIDSPDFLMLKSIKPTGYVNYETHDPFSLY